MIDRLLPLRALTDLLAVEESTILDWVASGRFPPGVLLPNGEQRWREYEVTVWMARLGLGRHQAEQEDVDIGSLSELGQEILQALTELPDGWHPSRDVAAKVGGDVDTSAGSWGRAIRELRKSGLIASGTRGLCLTLAPARHQPGTSQASAGHQPGRGE